MLKRLTWLRFGIRTLLVVMVVASIPLGWLAFRIRQAKLQEQAVQRLREVGGSVNYDQFYKRRPKIPGPAWARAWLGDEFFREVDRVVAQGPEVTPAALAGLRHLPDVRELYLNHSQAGDQVAQQCRLLDQLQSLYLGGTRITDDGLSELTELSELKTLVLYRTGITDRGLAVVAGLPQLKALYLGGTRVTNQGLTALSKATLLTELDLSDTAVTDDGLPALSRLPRLTVLELNTTQISDRGLDHLARFPRLRQLDVRGTGVTRSAAVVFQRRRPECVVFAGPIDSPR